MNVHIATKNSASNVEFLLTKTIQICVRRFLNFHILTTLLTSDCTIQCDLQKMGKDAETLRLISETTKVKLGLMSA